MEFRVGDRVEVVTPNGWIKGEIIDITEDSQRMFWYYVKPDLVFKEFSVAIMPSAYLKHLEDW